MSKFRVHLTIDPARGEAWPPPAGMIVELQWNEPVQVADGPTLFVRRSVRATAITVEPYDDDPMTEPLE